ncbi:MAG TPA: hypothetical protein VHP38_11170 [Ruminiclostridium sp.]|nr:hypothetical protein [Ruminiclostridium sp.]
MNIKSEKGATLTEVIAAVAILGMLLIPLSYIFITSCTTYMGESDRASAQQAAREILYGNGLNFNGIIGDLEKSGAPMDCVIVTNDAAGISMSIPEHGTVREYTYLNHTLRCNGTPIYQDSSTGKQIKINSFTVQRISRSISNDDNDKIRVQVEVSCGQSGSVKLESSYRFPDIEK